MTKQEIERTVSLFYPASVKTIYINTVNGTELIPPYPQVFVSLGITSSIKTLNEVRDNLNSISYLSATLATTKSIRKEDGKYSNEVLKFGEYTKDDQYLATNMSGGEFEKILDRAASLDMYEELMQSEHVDQANQLKELIGRLDEKDCWGDMAIAFDIVDDTPMISLFHRYVNYRKDQETGAEYRIGILVEMKK